MLLFYNCVNRIDTNDVPLNLSAIPLKWTSKLSVNIYNMEDSGIVTASDIVWFMVSNTESAEQETTDWTFSESLILLSFCFIYVWRCHLFQLKWHLLLSLEHIKRYCWYQGNTARIYHVHLYFLVSFLNQETVLLCALF